MRIFTELATGIVWIMKDESEDNSLALCSQKAFTDLINLGEDISNGYSNTYEGEG